MATSPLWYLRRFGRSKLVHRAATELMARVFPHDKVNTIRRGPLKGWSWYRHTDHQFWMPLGAYEEETCRWLESNIGPGSTFLDIGANAGYFTLLGSKLVGREGQVFAFEPVPLNIDVIRRQLELNKCENVSIETVAISDSVGQLSFDIESRNANSHLSDIEIVHAASAPSQSLMVESTTLDEWVRRTKSRPDVLKVDVEGAEVLLLRGAQEVLRTARPRIILSTHSAELEQTCRQMLGDAQYEGDRAAGICARAVGLSTRQLIKFSIWIH